MPPPVTPSPFRLSRRHPPTRRSAGPQFANSPRFLLSQSTPQKGRSDVEIVDDDAPPSTAPVTRTPAQPRQAGTQPRRQRDVIEDSDDGDWLGNADTRDNGVNELADDSIASSPPVGPGTPGPLDAEFDALFAPTRDGNKRQRLSAGGVQNLGQPLPNTLEQRHSSSPEPQGPAFDPLQTPAPRLLPRPAAQDQSTQATPVTSVKPWAPLEATPGSTQTPFRSRPRFVLSTQKPSSSQPAFRAETPSATQPTSPPERRKPAFVLPRSPSPNAALEDIPAPFSPSSRTLHRRGKNRSGVGYAPGGMAAEVRSWILEMGSKHEPLNATNQAVGTTGDVSTDLGRYLVAARVLQVRPAVLSSSGALSFVRAEKVASLPTDDNEEKELLNILIMGPSRYKPQLHGPSSGAHGLRSGYILEGDVLGIHRGLAWNVTFEEYQALATANEFQTEAPRDDESSKAEQWLIATEWDHVEQAT
ncbi:uncharacterized protein N7496_005023 [Penicillium cataractarum]|uniref:Uncharacterized protein n=1 Tax=Penicillium cataractarum TaxID=2100454 RepID=A0A9W9SHZ5_9EURO|nr:uncharacterized protein N7496_005023 [Penicillium cataractarum]KAJ5377614.1 hypothetical protein N7496_005023 [Penicillium cataractarum]